MFNKLKSSLIIIISLSLIGLFACKKSNDKAPQSGTETDKSEMETVGQNDVNENNEDLLTVDYKEFYDQLAPHGEWIEVSAKDLGIEMKTSSADNPAENNSFASAVFGIKNANATSDIDLGAFFVWRPSPELAVGLATTTPEPIPAAYVPYTNGQWVNTDAGWYFRAPTPYEEITSHYGRWVFSDDMGWVWMPGRLWAPSWVVFKEDPTYIAWAPVPASTFIINNSLPMPIIDDDRFIVIEKRHFTEPAAYKYMYMYKENKNKIMIKEMVFSPGIIVRNNMVINQGPGVSTIEQIIGTPIHPVTITTVSSPGQVKYGPNQYSVYVPTFTKVKSVSKVNNIAVTKPSTFKRPAEVKVTKETKGIEKEMKKEEIEKSNKVEGKTKAKEKGEIKKQSNEKPKGYEKKGHEDKGVEKKSPGNTEKGKNIDKAPKEKGDKDKTPRGKGKK